MTKVRINYDGWLSLPAAVRQKLGLTTGTELELELSDGSIVLRPVRSDPAAEQPAPEPMATAEPPVSAAPELPAAAAASPIVKRGPGRPRKTALPVLPSTLKARGGRRKATPAAGPAR
jgi:AbrB family looped-hinge helix DNA binding protein